MKDGSLLDLIHHAAPYRLQAALFFVSLPAATFLIGRLLLRTSGRACAVFLSVAVHLAIVPGVGMALIVGYLLLFAQANLLGDYDAILLFGPIACMILTLLAAKKILPFEAVPGFERLSGLMLTSAAAFLILALLSRMALRVYFLGSWTLLIGVFVVLFLMLRVGARRLFGDSS